MAVGTWWWCYEIESGSMGGKVRMDRTHGRLVDGVFVDQSMRMGQWDTKKKKKRERNGKEVESVCQTEGHRGLKEKKRKRKVLSLSRPSFSPREENLTMVEQLAGLCLFWSMTGTDRNSTDRKDHRFLLFLLPHGDLRARIFPFSVPFNPFLCLPGWTPSCMCVHACRMMFSKAQKKVHQIIQHSVEFRRNMITITT